MKVSEFAAATNLSVSDVKKLMKSVFKLTVSASRTLTESEMEGLMNHIGRERTWAALPQNQETVLQEPQEETELDNTEEQPQVAKDNANTPVSESAIAPHTCELPQETSQAGDIVQRVEFLPQVARNQAETLLATAEDLSMLDGIELADASWDALETGFVEQSNSRYDAVVNVMSAELEDKFNRLKSRAEARKQRRASTLGEHSAAASSVRERARELMSTAKALTKYPQ